MDVHEKYMKRCFELAKSGLGRVAPNPMVGSVIVHKNKIIGEGYHREYGEAHAEVNAINSVQEKKLLMESTLYVNLEPCSHHGKTPPCTDLIIKNKIPRVIISNVDPFEEVDGSGIQKLKNAGIEVITGILNKEGEELNKRFFCFHKNKRPHIILKWAQTADGFMDIDRSSDPEKKYWITSPLSKLLVHKWRAEEDAIIVGTNTVKNDNPSLTVRLLKGKNPFRIIIDKNLILNQNQKIFDNSAPSLIFNHTKHSKDGNKQYIQFDENSPLMPQILKQLYKLNIQSLIVEGGKNVLEQFIDQNLWDEARIFYADKNFHKGLKAPKIIGIAISTDHSGSDLLKIIQNNNK